jgi:hypothetical protein
MGLLGIRQGLDLPVRLAFRGNGVHLMESRG